MNSSQSISQDVKKSNGSLGDKVQLAKRHNLEKRQQPLSGNIKEIERKAELEMINELLGHKYEPLYLRSFFSILLLEKIKERLKYEN